MLNVVCVKNGDKYGPEYVNRLYAGVRRNLKQPFKFWCLTDNSADLWPGIIKLGTGDAGLDGWWAKMLLFKPRWLMMGLRGRVLYLDLDTVITGDLGPLAAYGGEFCILRDFYRPDGYGSGVMAFEAGYGRHIWEAFSRDPERVMADFETAGDQGYLETQVKDADLWQDVAPGACVSYKAHCRSGLPEGAVTVSFHGSPKPHEVDEPWVRKHWNLIGG